MDYRFTDAEEAFRREVSDWIAREVPQRWYDLASGIWEETGESWAISREFQKKLGQKRWLAPAYPRKYGGAEMSVGEQLVLSQELNRADAPIGVEKSVTVNWVGPTIMLFGNEEQKEKYVRDIAAGEIAFCLGYSEPNAGSDLASLQTTAIEQDDAFVVNGQKIWTSFAHCADYCWLAARTDPRASRKYDGISMFIVDMKTPGITVNPIINLLERHSFNEVFFDDVRVPKENLVGEKNKGWHQLMVALEHERSPSGRASAFERTLQLFIDFVQRMNLRHDPRIRQQIAQFAIEMEVTKLLEYHLAWIYSQGKHPSYEASMALMTMSEVQRRQAEIGMAILGPYAYLQKDSKWSVELGKIERMLLSCLSIGIGGGTNEIQRNIIAQRGLGLPR